MVLWVWHLPANEGVAQEITWVLLSLAENEDARVLFERSNPGNCQDVGAL